MTRLHPDVRVRIPSPNYSERSTPIQAIVLHSTEGRNIPYSITDLQGLGRFFASTSAQASSHVATDSDGWSARYVEDAAKAWTCAGYNSQTLNIEQVGFAAGQWTDAQVRETARWIAHWSKRYGIPIRRGRVLNGRVIWKGVLRHSDLGEIGGGHSDPGPNFPFKRCLEYARKFRKQLDAE